MQLFLGDAAQAMNLEASCGAAKGFRNTTLADKAVSRQKQFVQMSNSLNIDWDTAIPNLMWTSGQAQRDFKQLLTEGVPSNDNQELANKMYTFLSTKYDFLDWSIAVFNPDAQWGIGLFPDCSGDVQAKELICSDRGGGWAASKFPAGDRSKSVFITWTRTLVFLGPNPL